VTLPKLRSFNWLGAGFLVLLVVLWELSDRVGLVQADFIPAPSEVLGGASALLEEGSLQAAVLHTASVAVTGWLVASALGLTVGTLLGLSDGLWRWTAASIEVLRSFPSITFVPLFVLLLGFSQQMELAVIIYASQWPVLVNSMDGVRGIGPGLKDVSKTFGLTGLRKVTTIVLPAAASKIIVGLRLGLNLALILAVAAEVVGNPAGLGNGLITEQQALQPGRMFAYFISVGLLGMILNVVLQALIRLAVPGIVAAAGRGRG
jgi:ABC-type nitrate/sulfonate/bicarbonate transport system permease component